MKQDKKSVFYYENPVAIDEQSRTLGMTDSFSEFNNSYDPVSVNNAFIQKFISSSAIYGSMSIVLRIDWSGVYTAKEKYVFFVNISPKLFYQRIPPSLSSVRIQIGIVMKIIPVAQILQGRDGMAIKTAL